ncbi:MAG: hypothetical protein D6806_08810 [Deltaproteobacteria bacterium]|nr:MAG: hypothetical protein D6806_08810 [Deltaproteobacteria bacterium]
MLVQDLDRNPLACREGKQIPPVAEYVTVKPVLLLELQKSLEDVLGAKTAEFFYTAGSAWARQELRRIRGALSLEGSELAGTFCQRMGQLGWGSWRVADSGPTSLSMVVESGPIAKGYGSSDFPVCHLLCGMVASLAEAVLGGTASCTEIECAATGSSSCSFLAEVQSADEGDAWSW